MATTKPVAKKVVAPQKPAEKVAKKVVATKPEAKVAKVASAKKPAAKKTTSPVTSKPATKPAVKSTPKPNEVVKVTPAKKPAAKKSAAAKKPTNTVRATLIKRFYGRLPKHRATLTGLGLRKINQTVELIDNPQTRGMLNKVSYLLKIED